MWGPNHGMFRIAIDISIFNDSVMRFNYSVMRFLICNDVLSVAPRQVLF